MLRAARRCAVKARTCAINQLKALLVTAPEQVAAPLRGSRTAALMAACCGLRPGGGEAVAAAKMSMRCLARRHRTLNAEISELDAEIARLCAKANPALTAARGAGADTARGVAHRRGRQPPAPAQRSVDRCAARGLPRRGILGAHRAPPPQPRRRPTSQQHTAAHRDGPAPLRPTNQRLRHPTPRRGQQRPRDHPQPQTLHRTRNLPAAHRPSSRPSRSRPATTTPTQRNDPRHRSRSPQRLAHSHLTPRPTGQQSIKTVPLAECHGLTGRLRARRELQYGSYERSQALTLIDDPRFKVPLYTIGQAARIVDVPNSTFATWAKGYLRHPPDRPDVTGQPVLTCLTAATRTSPSIPFVGLAEGLVLAAIRRSGVPMQRIRPALDELQPKTGSSWLALLMTPYFVQHFVHTFVQIAVLADQAPAQSSTR